MVLQELRTLEEEGTRIVRERLLLEISITTVDDGSEGVPSKSSTSSSTCVVFGLDEDAIGRECVWVNGARWPSEMVPG